MVMEPTRDGVSKFQRYRASKRGQGMKLLRVWVPDPHAAGFADEARRQAALLRDSLQEAEALAFVEADGDWGDRSA